MPELLKQFSHARLHLETWRSAELVSRVRDGRLDFAWFGKMLCRKTSCA
ncbi:hypothetical protein [Verrucomicrobium spinosum]|nr:hypothetical protein [Verrucomicrobium spinosum]